jgi:NAD(P)-dependent dehydrogenase (short-subunit alcohol dehydrogenase family)
LDKQLDIAPLTMHKTGLLRNALAGKIAVVTGGASNIGLGTARSLAWLGAKVVIAARNTQRGAAAAELIDKENKPGTAIFVSTDVSNRTSMKAMAKRAFDTFGKVDILVNNAMDMSLAAPILKSTIQQLDRQYAVAVRGALIGIQLFVPGMQERRYGVVTYIATTFRYPSGPSNYCAAKAATSSMMASLAAELGPVENTGVSVFTFIPTLVGRTRTDPPDQPRTFISPPAMPGYPGPIPPEDCGAALAFSITRSADLHGSGIMIGQAFRKMDWKFPKPETVFHKDFDRIRDSVQVRMFGYIGPGFPDPLQPRVSVNRSEAPPDEKLDNSALR